MSKLLGAKEYDKVKSVSSFGFWTGAATTAVFCVLSLALARPLLIFPGASEGSGRGGEHSEAAVRVKVPKNRETKRRTLTVRLGCSGAVTGT